MAYIQYPIEFDIYMELLHGVDIEEVRKKTHVLDFLRNLYVQKQTDRVWNQYLVSGLTKLGLLASTVDECVLYQGNTVFFSYVDGGVLLSPDSGEVDTEINRLKALGYDV